MKNILFVCINSESVLLMKMLSASGLPSRKGQKWPGKELNVGCKWNRKGQISELEEGKVGDQTAFEVSLMRQLLFCSLSHMIFRSVRSSHIHKLLGYSASQKVSEQGYEVRRKGRGAGGRGDGRGSRQ